jgi:hypothetical protein
MNTSLSLIPDLYLRDGIVFGTNRRAIRYSVQGLPDGGEVSIVEFGGRWRIFRAKHPMGETSVRSYGTAEEAFTALRYEVV